MSSAAFGTGSLYFVPSSVSGLDRQKDVSAALNKIPGILKLEDCEFLDRRTDTGLRSRMSLPRHLSESLPAHGFVRLHMRISIDKQKEYLQGNEPATGTEYFTVFIRYGPYIPTTLVMCHDATPDSRPSQSLYVVKSHMKEWWEANKVKQETGVSLQWRFPFPFPLDTAIMPTSSKQRFASSRTTLTPSRKDIILYSRDRFATKSHDDILYELQKSIQAQLSYTFYTALLRDERREKSVLVYANAQKLIESHSSDGLSGQAKRLFQGKEAQDVSIEVLTAKMETREDLEFHQKRLPEIKAFAEIIVLADIMDAFSSETFDAELSYSERVLDVIETRRRSDFQVYIAAIIALLVALATILSNVFR